MGESINMSASSPAYFPIIWPKHIWVVTVIFFSPPLVCACVCLWLCVCVLWTHCLAKSLWGSLNRLHFPSGKTIQVTDTESWLQSKWPLKSWKCLLIWHLMISDVSADYETQSSSSVTQLSRFFTFPLQEMRKCRQKQKPCNFSGVAPLHKHDKGQAADERCLMCESLKCCILFWLFMLSHLSCQCIRMDVLETSNERTLTRCLDFKGIFLRVVSQKLLTFIVNVSVGDAQG